MAGTLIENANREQGLAFWVATLKFRVVAMPSFLGWRRQAIQFYSFANTPFMLPPLVQESVFNVNIFMV